MARREPDSPRSDVAGPERVDGVREFDDFYSGTYRRTLRLAFSLTGDWGHAEDLVQDAYASAHREWARLSVYDDPSAWVRRAVLNRASSRWRRIGHELSALARFSARRGSAPQVPDAIDDAFWKAVAALPPQQTRAVVLHYVEDLSITDVAQRLGCSPGSVKTHLSRARRALHTSLGETDTTEARHD